MPVEGTPDPQQHRLCLRCARWHRPEEGSMIVRGASGVVGAIAARLRAAGADKPPRFICSDCQYTLRTRNTLGWLFVAVSVVVMLVTKELRFW